MTAAGRDALQAELEQLETVGREEIAAQIKTAREWGDLKENAEYHAAKDAQAHLETRIASLREQLLTAQIVEETTGGDVAAFGTTVEIEDEQSGRKLTYRLVAAREAEPSKGKISIDAPMGAALAGKKVGEVAVVQTPGGERRMKVVSIS